MKILLVNFALRANHGGILQCYALQEVLRQMGHNVVKAEAKRHYRFRPSLHLLLAIPKRAFVRFFVNRHTTKVMYEYYEDRKEFMPRRNADRFIDKYLNTVRVDSMSELDGADYDAVIVGSDQVWRKAYTDKLLTDKSASDNAFLAFTEGWNCKRIAYAASIGVDYWEYTREETTVLSDLIKKFDAVSVREDSAIDLIHKYLNPSLKIEHLLDPTLLLDKQTYIELFQRTKTPKSKGELLVYILDVSDEKDQIVTQISSQLGLRPFMVNNPNFEKWNLPVEERVQTSIELWLRGFYDARFVVADSFHACVFSIIFEKPFAVIANKDRGITRITSLLKMLGLENRIIYNTKDWRTVPHEIDWEPVRERKKSLKKKSLSFLTTILSN